jgi:beta-mannosidase
MLQDLQPGAGWGLITSCGRPKSPWYAFKRALKPVRVSLTDEGVNGLAIHVSNELGETRDVVLTISALRSGKTRVLNVKHTLTLAPRSMQTLSAFRLLGSFFDLNYAYRFQPPQHDTVIAALNLQETGEILSEAFYFPCGYTGVVPETSLLASVEEEAGSWLLQIRSERLARFVHIVDPCFRCEDDWFHLTPDRPRRIKLISLNSAPLTARPRGLIRALNATSPVPYEAPA